MPYTVKQAAEAVGRTKPSILRAIQKGKISAAKDEHGEWVIEPAELHRVYPPLTAHPEASGGAADADVPAPDGSQGREIALLRERLTDQAETIADLRRRLDQAQEERRCAEEERRQAQAQMAALLTDQRDQSPAAVPSTGQAQATGKRRWWRFERRR